MSEVDYSANAYGTQNPPRQFQSAQKEHLDERSHKLHFCMMTVADSDLAR